MNSVELKAFGKVNLSLDVTGKRPDGYHEVRMIMQTVSLYDRLIFTKAESGDISLKTNLRFLPTDSNNLIVKAIDLVRTEYGITDGVNVDLEKRIPVAAGMAGGSSDAAASIRAMNRLFGLGMDPKRMRELGVKLGADVPYCIEGGTALAEGIGEKLTALPNMPECRILLVKPSIGVSTPVVYKKLDDLESYPHPDVDAMISTLRGQDLRGLCDLMGNALESVTCREYPVIEDIKRELLELGAVNAMMSGSGPTVFAVFDDRKTSDKAYYRMKGSQYGRYTFMVHPIGRMR